jgi:HK97 family phage major capsid protein
MPAGSVTLLEANKYGKDTLKRGVIETLVSESPVLEYLPFTPIAGNALEVTVEGSLPAPAFRDVNETYTRSWGSDTKRYFGVSILGGEVFIDNYILRVKANVVSAKATQYGKFAKAMSRTFDKSFLDGTGTAKDFKGINALVDEGLGIWYDAGAGGATLTLDMLDIVFDLLRNQSTASFVLLNRTLRRKITGLARSTYTGVSLIDIGTDVFGRKVTEYNGVPLKISGDDIDGNALLGFDEYDTGGGGLAAYSGTQDTS